MKKVLVLHSGGQDSTTCLFWAIKRFEKVYAIGFDYNQKHLIELDHARKICLKENIDYKILNIRGLLNNSALIEHEKDINKPHNLNNNLPNTFVPGRNALFLSFACSYGINNKIYDLVTGVCETDYSGYPDCREEFIYSMQKTLSLAVDKKIKIHTPLMKLSKAETWKLAKKLDCLKTIINDTITDYNGSKIKNEWGYGKLDNQASILRSKGYYEAKKKNWI